jgi:hypothetical protein
VHFNAELGGNTGDQAFAGFCFRWQQNAKNPVLNMKNGCKLNSMLLMKWALPAIF